MHLNHYWSALFHLFAMSTNSDSIHQNGNTSSLTRDKVDKGMVHLETRRVLQKNTKVNQLWRSDSSIFNSVVWGYANLNWQTRVRRWQIPKIITEDYIISASTIYTISYTISRQQIIRRIDDLNNTVYKLALTDIYMSNYLIHIWSQVYVLLLWYNIQNQSNLGKKRFICPKDSLQSITERSQGSNSRQQFAW